MKFRVIWEIDIDDESVMGPRAAAEEAWFAMRAPDSIACIFMVKDEYGGETEVDLSPPRTS